MKGFFSGVLFAAPVTALLMWWVFGYTNLVGTKVERATATSELNGAVFNKEFDKRWDEMGGGPASCSSADATHVADLRTRVAELQKEVDQERQNAKRKAAAIDREVDSTIKKMEGKNENH